MSHRPTIVDNGPRAADWLFGNATSIRALMWGIVPLRLLVGFIMAFHGSQKAFGWFGGPGYGGIAGMLGGMGFPAPGLFAALLVAGELGGGLMLFLGVATRVGAAAVVVIMAVALLTAHRGDPFSQTHAQQLLLASGILFLVTGGGALCLFPAALRPKTRFEETSPTP